VLAIPSRPNEVWSIDFAMDALANGRRIKCLTVVDDFTRECLDIAVDYGISHGYVTHILERVCQFRGLPRATRTDPGAIVHESSHGPMGLRSWAHATVHCMGYQQVVEGKGVANGACQWTDATGDTFTGSYRHTVGKRGVWKFLGGTGK
jgi:hypothetical protein